MSLTAQAKNADSNITVYLQESNLVPFKVLWRGQATASAIFAAIQVRLEWRQGAEPTGEKSGETIGVQFDAGLPGTLHPGALAYATLHGKSGTRIHILLDRVVKMGGSPQQAGVLLGHVMAHEITHVLEGFARHSDSGLMKAHWDDRDLEQMALQPLPFDPADVQLVRQGVENRGVEKRARQRSARGTEVANRH